MEPWPVPRAFSDGVGEYPFPYSFGRSGLRPSLVRGDSPRNAPLQNHRSLTVRRHSCSAAQQTPPRSRALNHVHHKIRRITVQTNVPTNRYPHPAPTPVPPTPGPQTAARPRALNHVHHKIRRITVQTKAASTVIRIQPQPLVTPTPGPNTPRCPCQNHVNHKIRRITVQTKVRIDGYPHPAPFLVPPIPRAKSALPVKLKCTRVGSPSRLPLSSHR